MNLLSVARARRESPGVDVTAFLSLMVILIPFLLISTVLSQISILELQAPASEADSSAAADPLQLQVTVRETVIEVRHRQQKAPLLLQRTAEGGSWNDLAGVVVDLKARFPQSREATILLEPQIPYDVLVKVMDVVRIKPRQYGRVIRNEALFADLTLGEAPAVRPARSEPK